MMIPLIVYPVIKLTDDDNKNDNYDDISDDDDVGDHDDGDDDDDADLLNSFAVFCRNLVLKEASSY